MMNTFITLFAVLTLLCASLGHAVADEVRSYYHNPDGGSYLHADPHCSTISSKYWPLMVEISLAQLKQPEYRNLRLCKTCCKEDNDAAAFFQGKKTVTGPFDLTQKAAENYDTYISYCQSALSYLIDEIGDPQQQYNQLVEDGKGYLPWGHPDEDDISRETAISIAYAALETYIGIEEPDMFYYYAEPWLDVSSDLYWAEQLGKTHSEHEWRVELNRVVNTHEFYDADGYYVYIHTKNGLITRISRH